MFLLGHRYNTLWSSSIYVAWSSFNQISDKRLSLSLYLFTKKTIWLAYRWNAQFEDTTNACEQPLLCQLSWSHTAWDFNVKYVFTIDACDKTRRKNRNYFKGSCLVVMTSCEQLFWQYGVKKPHVEYLPHKKNRE